MHRKRVGIHQANFIPWLGYFSKLAASDVFIALDDALLQKKGGSWCNRARLLNSGQAGWLTVPIRRDFRGFRECREIEIDDSWDWRGKMRRGVGIEYGKSRFFEEALPLFERVVNCEAPGLVDYNLFGVRTVAEALGIDTAKIRLASDLDVRSSGTQRLIDLTRQAGGSVYLCGGGSAGYLEEKLFEGSGVALEYYDFRHPVYDQGGEDFISGLSTFDALFRVGVEGARKLLFGDGGAAAAIVE